MSSPFSELFKGIKMAYHKGDKVHCPICDARFKEFGKFGVNRRENAKCYSCKSLERHRLLWMYFNNKTDLFGGKKSKVLHFAPERMFFDVFSTTDFIDYYPCDLFPNLYNYGGTKIHKANITEIPFESDQFDVILCNHVLEHIPDDALAMSELKRVMKPNGWGVFQVPLDYKLQETYEDFSITDPKEREKAFGQYDHVRVYGKDYKNRLTAAGFLVDEDPFVREFSTEDSFKYGLMTDEMVYYCKVAN